MERKCGSKPKRIDISFDFGFTLAVSEARIFLALSNENREPKTQMKPVVNHFKRLFSAFLWLNPKRHLDLACEIFMGSHMNWLPNSFRSKRVLAGFSNFLPPDPED